MTQLADAFEHFARTAKISGLTTAEETPQGTRLSRVERDGAELRLRWEAEDEFLSLQISHGPASQRAGWLDLYSAKCPHGQLPESADAGVSFESSVEYGIELMAPNTRRREQ